MKSPVQNIYKDTVQKFKEYPALIIENRMITYRQFDQWIQASVIHLTESGFKEGERIVILAENSAEYVILLWAMWLKGITAVPVNPTLPALQVKENLKIIDCYKLITDNFPLSLDASEIFKFYELTDLIDDEKLSKKVSSKLFRSLNPLIPSTVLLTSGSLGQTKAVLHSHENHYFSALGSNQNISVRPGDSWMLSLPLYHVSGISILWRTFLAGGAVAVSDLKTDLSESLTKRTVSHISLVPTQLYKLLKERQNVKRLMEMKAILLGGSSIPEDLIYASVNHELPVYTSYGSTEMASQITTTRPDDGVEGLLTSGKLLPHREIKIAGDNEIYVKGKSLFSGYLHRGQIKKATDSDGWFHTGDLGFINKAGYLTVTGRKDNMFISGGENIQPEEIERVLRKIDGVEDALVVPVDNQHFGKRPVAFIKVSGNMELQRDKLTEYLKKELPPFKIPDLLLTWPDEANTAGIKIERKYFEKIAAVQISEQ